MLPAISSITCISLFRSFCPGGGGYGTAFRPIQQHPDGGGDVSSNIPTLVPTPLRSSSRPPLLETPPGFRIMSPGGQMDSRMSKGCLYSSTYNVLRLSTSTVNFSLITSSLLYEPCFETSVTDYFNFGTPGNFYRAPFPAPRISGIPLSG